MKHKQLSNGITAFLLSIIISLSGIGCMASAYNIPVRNWLMVAVGVILFALLRTISCPFRFGGAASFLLFSIICLFTAGTWLPSVERVLNIISTYCNTYYHWGVIRWSTTQLSTISPDPALCLLGCLVADAVCRTVCRRNWIGPALLAGLLPLVVCCITTGAIPSVFCVVLLLAGLLLLTMTQLTRRQDKKAAARLTALLLVPVLLFSFLIVSSARKDPHKYEAETTLDRLLDLLTTSDGTSGLINTLGNPNEKVDLTAIGPNDPSDQEVLTVQADHSGLIYLRGRSYDTYTGTNWSCLLDTKNEGGWPTSGLKEQGTVYISTTSRLNLRYFPYYVQSGDWTSKLSAGAYANPNRKASYSFQWMRPNGSSVTYHTLSDEETDAYTELPYQTGRNAQAILSEILGGAVYGEATVVQKIAAYVRNSATYDLNTQAMPEEEGDFAIWFLRSSDTGYCVHFASAATVLLRAAGIPARYVTGYIAYTIPNVEVPVTGAQAHAWVEYLHPERGWTVLDATPGAESIPPVPTAPEETTQPPTETTEPPTETEDTPTETSEPTPVTRPTRPSTATTPTEPPAPSVWEACWIQPVIWALLILALVWLQYGLRLRLRQQYLNRGGPKRRALRRWRYVRRLAWLTRQKPPADLLALAEKAVFSQHRLTNEELQEFDLWIRQSEQTLLDRPWPLKLLFRLIFAIK